MPRGRKPKPLSMANMGAKSHHKARGPGAMAQGSLPKNPPRELSEAERAAWKRIVKAAPRGLLTALDGPALGRLATHLAAFDALRKRLAELQIDDPAAMSLRRLLKGESELCLRYESEMALSVTGRGRVIVPAEDRPMTEFEKMRAELATRKAK